MRFSRLIVALAVWTFSTAPSLAAPPPALVLNPSSPWQIDHADDSCRLIRTFGEGDLKTFLIMERFSPGDNFSVLVAGKPLSSSILREGRQVTVKLTFGPAETEQERPAAPARFMDLPALLIGSASIAELGDDGNAELWVTQITPQRESAVKSLNLIAPGRKNLTLALGSMGVPMSRLRGCIDELLTHWGIDVARFARRTADAIPASNPGTWLRPDDYPRDMAMRGTQGLVHFRLMVGPDGKPESCHIQRSTRPQEFDDAVCRGLMRRAVFTPARDGEGRPFKSFFQNSVRFVIEA